VKNASKTGVAKKWSGVGLQFQNSFKQVKGNVSGLQ